jgi:hypothetical protein
MQIGEKSYMYKAVSLFDDNTKYMLANAGGKEY